MFKWIKKVPLINPAPTPVTPEDGALRIRQDNKNIFYVDRYFSIHNTWSPFWNIKLQGFPTYFYWMQDNPIAGHRVEEFPSFEKAKAFYDRIIVNRKKIREEKAEQEEQLRIRREQYMNVFYPPDFEKVKIK